jgi:hypothetical protein
LHSLKIADDDDASPHAGEHVMPRLADTTPLNPALQASTLDPYFVLQRSSDATTQYLQAVRLVLGTSASSTDICIGNLDLDPKKDLRIDADTVELGSQDAAHPGTPFTLALPGKNVTIVARVVVGNGGVIDVSGGAGVDCAKGQAPTQAAAGWGDGDPGTDGTAGAPGTDGANAGTITIAAESLVGALTARANGGAGGRGEDGGGGGNGGIGMAGDIGERMGDTILTPPGLPAAGGLGGTGGRGGLAGAPGVGGAAGQVTIASIAANPQFVGQAQPGARGSAADAGQFGTGGPGGPGGSWWMTLAIGGVPTEVPNTQQPTGPHGVDGQSGALTDNDQSMVDMFTEFEESTPGTIAGMMATLQPAAVGCAQLALANARAASRATPPAPTITTLADYSSFGMTYRLPLSQLQLSLHQAKLSYLDSDYVSAGGILAWIYHVAATPSGSAADVAQWTALHQRAATLLHQLTQGLNFFGDATNYVPLVAYQTYQTDLDAIFTLGGIIEQAYDDYTTKTQDQVAQRKAVTSSLGQVDAAIGKLNDQITTLGADMGTGNTLIESLATDIQNKTVAMNAADDAFQEAVRAKADQCTFADLLTAITTLISVAEDAYAAYNDVKDVTGALTGLKSISGVVDGVTTIIKTAKTVESDADDVEKQFTSIKDGFNSISNLNSTATPDVAKLVMKEKDFDAVMQPYLDMPEAKDYVQAVHDYVTTVQARNQKLVENDRFATQIASLTAEVADKKAQTSALQTSWANNPNSDPTIPAIRAFMAAIYQDTRTNLLTLQYQEHQAMNYLLLQDGAFSGADSSIAELASAQETIITAVIDAQNRIQNVEGPFIGASVVLSAADQSYTSAFATFKSTGQITFAVTPDLPAFTGYANTRLTSFEAKVHGATTTGNQLVVKLTHSGRALFVTTSGDNQVFSHAPLALNYKYDTTSGDQDAYSELTNELIGLSPFTTWTLSISKDPKINPGVDLSKVDQITVTFAGETNFLASSTLKAADAVLTSHSPARRERV